MKGNRDRLDTGKGLGRLNGGGPRWNLGLYEHPQGSNPGESVKWAQTALVGIASEVNRSSACSQYVGQYASREDLSRAVNGSTGKSAGLSGWM